MTNLAEKMELDDAFLGTAVVRSARPDGIVLDRRGRTVAARRAAMCLVAPGRGDLVLTALVEGQCWVLGVLDRPDGQPTWLEVDGDLGVRLRKGRFAVVAQDAIELTTAGRAKLTSRSFELRALDGDVVIDRLRWLGDKLEAEVGKVAAALGTLTTIAERIHQRAQRSYRFVRECDHVRAGHLDYKADGYARVHAGDTAITAEKLMKVDGSQVHIG